jgi:hypothetical protein
MILKSRRGIVAALATMAIMLTGSLFAAGSASAALGTKVAVAPSFAHVNGDVNPDPIVIVDR